MIEQTMHEKYKITDAHGLVLGSFREPLPGSVVMTEGEHGTAWQKFFSDGLWHRVGSTQKKTWAQMLEMRNLVVVYDATVRKEGEVT